jgi:hypothetical protein
MGLFYKLFGVIEIIMYLLIWLMRTSRYKLHQKEFLNPSILPPYLRQSFGDAMLVKVDVVYRQKLIKFGLRKYLWSKLLPRNLIFRLYYIRYLLSRLSRLEKINSMLSLLPLSRAYFPYDYGNRASQAIKLAPPGSIVLNSFCQFRKTSTDGWDGEQDTVEGVITNGPFEAILGRRSVWMGLNDGLRLKVCVVKYNFGKKDNVTASIFHPTTNTLICGRGDGTVDFFDFDYDSMAEVPSFDMKLVASLPCNPIKPSPVRSIRSSSNGRWFWVKYTDTPSLLFSRDEKNSFTMHKIIVPESLFHETGVGMHALAVFDGMIITSHSKMFVVWNFDESDGSLKMVARMPHIVNSRGLNPGCVVQIIPCGNLVFVLRTIETLFLVQLEPDFTRCNVVFEQPVYDQYHSSKPGDYAKDSINFFGNILILVVPSQNNVKFFLIKDNQMRLVLKERIETPMCWSFNPVTSVFSYYYESSHSTRRCDFRV